MAAQHIPWEWDPLHTPYIDANNLDAWFYGEHLQFDVLSTLPYISPQLQHKTAFTSMDGTTLGGRCLDQETLGGENFQYFCNGESLWEDNPSSSKKRKMLSYHGEETKMEAFDSLWGYGLGQGPTSHSHNSNFSEPCSLSFCMSKDEVARSVEQCSSERERMETSHNQSMNNSSETSGALDIAQPVSPDSVLSPPPKPLEEISGATTQAKSRKKMKLATPVAYPFAVVKPCGVEGDVTLNDINKRILMRPTRPIQHPVGEYARHKTQSSISLTGCGLSGKAVVALTRIQTHGKGTITIMRTKG